MALTQAQSDGGDVDARALQGFQVDLKAPVWPHPIGAYDAAVGGEVCVVTERQYRLVGDRCDPRARSGAYVRVQPDNVAPPTCCGDDISNQLTVSPLTVQSLAEMGEAIGTTPPCAQQTVSDFGDADFGHEV